MLLAVMTSAGAQNASNAEKFYDRLLTDFAVVSGTKCNGVTLLSPSVNLGYKLLPRMSLFLHTETLYGHYDEQKSYARTQVYGGGAGIHYMKQMPWLSKCVARWQQDLVLNGKMLYTTLR